MNCLKRIGLILILTLFFGGIVFSADDAAVLLEKAIYAEEILGDADEAARIYRLIADNVESSRAAAAQAFYRLGKYHEERGQAAEARATFERLADRYPEQRELILRIPALAGAQQNIPQFLPAPWEDGEKLTFSNVVKELAGHVGTATPITDAALYIAIAGDIRMGQVFVAESDFSLGEKAWKFLSISPSIDRNSINYRTVLAMDGTFTSVEMRSMSGWDSDTGLTTQDTPEGVVVWRESGRTPQTFTVFPSKKLSPTQIFYGEQLVYLIRCLPLQTGFETYLPIFSNGNITNQRIFVEGREPIITPAGVFNAWKVSYGNKGAESFYWISDDSHRYPVKMTASPIGGTVELVSISKYEKNRPTEYLDQEIRFSLPSGWFAMPSTPVVIAEKEHMERWQGTHIGDPEFRTAGSVTVMNYFPKRNAQLLLSETVDGLIKANQAIYENYEVRPGSTENITVLGLPGVRLIVDRPTSGNNDIVIYYYVISAGDKAIRAFFRSRKEDFDRFKPVFDSIIDSIQLR